MRPIRYTGSNSNRKLSPELWKYCPINSIRDPLSNKDGIFLFDDFVNTPEMATAANTGKYATFSDAGSTIQQAADNQFGALAIYLDGGDNDEAWVTTGGNTGGCAAIASSSGYELWFECRIKKSTIANDVSGFFVGLAEEGLAAANTIADAGTMASKDFIGFFQHEDDGDSIDFSWRKAGQAQVDLIEGVDVPVADTYAKLGFHFDPNSNNSARRIEVFVDGVKQTTYGTQTQIAAATFPDGEELALLVGAKCDDGTTANTLTMDWWCLAQMGETPGS